MKGSDFHREQLDRLTIVYREAVTLQKGDEREIYYRTPELEPALCTPWHKKPPWYQVGQSVTAEKA